MKGRRTMGAVRSTLILVILGILSKLLGFGRDQLIAALFGAGAQTDAYLVGLAVPSLLTSMLSNGMATALIPLYSARLVNGEDPADFWRSVFWYTAGVLIAISAAGIAFSAQLTQIIAPGLDPSASRLAASCASIMFAGVAFSSLSALFKSVFNCHKQFAIPGLAPIVQNAAIISLAALLGRRLGVPALAFGQTFGMIAAFLIHLPWLRKAGLMPSFPGRSSAEPSYAAALHVAKLALPLFASSLISQVYTLVDKNLASRLPEGSIAALNFADKLRQLPLGLFVTALTTILYPQFADCFARGDRAGLAQKLSMAVRLVSAVLVPAAVGLAVLRYPIVSLVFQRGAFDAHDTASTAGALLAYSPGLIAAGISPVFSFALYSMKRTSVALFSGAATAGVNVLLDLALVGRLGHVGLALANSCANGAGMLVSWFALSAALGEARSQARLAKPLAKIFLASAFMALVALLVAGPTGFTVAGSGAATLKRLIGGFATILISIVAYWAALRLLRSEEAAYFRSLISTFLPRRTRQMTHQHPS